MVSSPTIEKTYCPECGEKFESGLKNCPNDGSRLFSYSVRDADNDPLIGALIEDRFRVESVLGEGGMGRVYKGVQVSVDRPVAIKVLRPELVDREDVIQRFLREARVISGFSHPNIVNLVEFGQDADHDVLYLVMELLDGMALADIIQHGRAHPNLACEVMVQVCRALVEAHSRGIVHRDLKPDNLMVVPMSDGSLQIKVLDFGIAHAVQGEKKLTSTGQVFGTAHYMAPEQASGKQVGPLTDVYSLGCILYELLCGALPFSAPSVMGLLVAHVQEPPPHLVDKLRDDDIPRSLVDLTMQMLEKDPTDRPDSVLAVRDRVEAIRRENAYGPVRIEPGNKVERRLFLQWLRGEHSARLQTTSDALDPVTGSDFDDLGTAETAAHASAPSIEDGPVDTLDGPPAALQPAGSPPSGTPPRPVASAISSPSTPPISQPPPVSDPSLEFTPPNDHKLLYGLAVGLLVIVAIVGGVLYNITENMNAVAAATDDAGADTTPIAQPDEPAEPEVAPEMAAEASIDAAEKQVVDAGKVAASAATEKAQASAKETNRKPNKKPARDQAKRSDKVAESPQERPAEKDPNNKATTPNGVDAFTMD